MALRVVFISIQTQTVVAAHSIRVTKTRARDGAVRPSIEFFAVAAAHLVRLPTIAACPKTIRAKPPLHAGRAVIAKEEPVSDITPARARAGQRVAGSLHGARPVVAPWTFYFAGFTCPAKMAIALSGPGRAVSMEVARRQNSTRTCDGAIRAAVAPVTRASPVLLIAATVASTYAATGHGSRAVVGTSHLTSKASIVLLAGTLARPLAQLTVARVANSLSVALVGAVGARPRTQELTVCSEASKRTAIKGGACSRPGDLAGNTATADRDVVEPAAEARTFPAHPKIVARCALPQRTRYFARLTEVLGHAQRAVHTHEKTDGRVLNTLARSIVVVANPASVAVIRGTAWAFAGARGAPPARSAFAHAVAQLPVVTKSIQTAVFAHTTAVQAKAAWATYAADTCCGI